METEFRELGSYLDEVIVHLDFRLALGGRPALGIKLNILKWRLAFPLWAGMLMHRPCHRAEGSVFRVHESLLQPVVIPVSTACGHKCCPLTKLRGGFSKSSILSPVWNYSSDILASVQMPT